MACVAKPKVAAGRELEYPPSTSALTATRFPLRRLRESPLFQPAQSDEYRGRRDRPTRHGFELGYHGRAVRAPTQTEERQHDVMLELAQRHSFRHRRLGAK
jgi:hypothetical protein